MWSINYSWTPAKDIWLNDIQHSSTWFMHTPWKMQCSIGSYVRTHTILKSEKYIPISNILAMGRVYYWNLHFYFYFWELYIDISFGSAYIYIYPACIHFLTLASRVVLLHGIVFSRGFCKRSLKSFGVWTI